MAATSTLVRYQDPLDVRERGAVAGFLAGYAGTTRVSYTTDLRPFAAWCAERGSACSRCAALIWRSSPPRWNKTVERDRRWRAACRRCAASTAPATWKGSWPATRAGTVRRPKVDPESQSLGLDRNGLGAVLVQAGLGSPRDHVLISLLAVDGLRISEALGTDIETWTSTAATAPCGSCAQAASRPPPRWPPARRRRSTSTSENERQGRSSSAPAAVGWTATPPTGP